MKKKLVLIILVSIIGIALSSLSLYQFVSLHMAPQRESSFCSISEHINCAQVHMSDWSSLNGIPLASFGIGFYLLMIVVAVLCLSGQVVRREEGRDFIAVSALLSSFASIALFLISELQIGALCPVCLAMYLTNFVLCFLSWGMAYQESFWGRIKNAFRAGIVLVSIWIPSKGSFSGLLVRIGTLFTLCLVLGAVVSSEMLFTIIYIKMQPPGTNLKEDQRQALISKYVAEWEAQPVVSLPILRNQIVAGDFTKGKETAPIKIVEYSDFECPHCQVLGRALSELLKVYPNEFEVIHKDFPLDSSCNKYSGPMHPGACKAAEFARCAGEQGKFWSVADLFFNSGIPQGKTDAIVEEKLIKETASLGLDLDPMRECLASGRHKAKILKDTEDANSLNVQGTPSVWINGKYMRAPHPDMVKAIIEKFSASSRQ